MSDPLGVTISAREIYDEIVGLREDVRSLTQASEAVTARQQDHEERIRALERWRYALPVAAVTSLGALAIEGARALGHN
ncbi:hypothetical protein [Streptacidiphilus sp. P02-A3a]|uniref:hypothetical protein n=1 Tax=Streptacidiphilus sp. P02-A3a TaxID=2704468 RepID=UPI0015FBFA39|nr:hypothetical protein [Streptacidiphilus sp. P02-A3a]QMU72131.1 hypothetical protein GXP74_31730 [Streptacidiphilus sp. P02-A3a]